MQDGLYSNTAHTKPVMQITIPDFSYDKLVLRDINLTIPDLVGQGQIVAILGRSGRGKSTLFRVISGLESRPNVKVILNINGQPTFINEGLVGLIDQKYTLFKHKTVYQTLMFVAKRNPLIKNPHEYVLYECKLWGLDEVMHKYPRELSGGQRQRTAILEKITLGNHYLILDEPISGLDVVAVEKVKNAMKNISSVHELSTLIFSTHDLHFAAEMADLIYVIGHEPSIEGSTIVAEIVGHKHDTYEKVYQNVYNS